MLTCTDDAAQTAGCQSRRNCAEIALRIARAAADMGLQSVAVQGDDAAAYLDIAGLVAQALRSGCVKAARAA